MLGLLTQALGPLGGNFQRGAWKNEKEFVSAIATGDVVAPRAAVEVGSERSQHAVAGFMAELVVELFEVIHVNNNETQRLLVAFRPSKFARKSFIQISPIEKVCQRIANGLFPQCFAKAQIRQRQGNMVRDRLAEVL